MQENSLIPINQTDIPTALQSWMLHSGSFMEKLRSQGMLHTTVQVVRQDWEVPQLDESNRLGLNPNTTALIREVLISEGSKHWMFARSIFPREILTGEEEQLANLENRPLGTLLFKGGKWQRSAFEFYCVTPNSHWHTYIAKTCGDLKQIPVWSRQSTFSFQEKKLLLTEVFLPDIESLC